MLKIGYSIPKYHSIVTIRVSSGSVSRNMRVVMLENSMFNPLLDYFIENQFKSLSWQNNLVHIVGLFIDYIYTYENGYFGEAKKRIYFMPNLVKLLHYGTIDSNGDDKFGLFWSPKKINRVQVLTNELYVFLTWYHKKNLPNHENIFSKTYHEMSLNEKMIFWKHWNNKKHTSMLSHIKVLKTLPSKFYLEGKSTIFKSDLNDLSYFPNDKILDLLFSGFKTNNKLDLRNILITMLMHFGGCRLSEPFHIFADDITEDPIHTGRALVKLYHPEDGMVRHFDKYTKKVTTSSRKEFLLKKYSLNPRNLETGTYRAGWKNLALDKVGHDNYALVYWFPTWAGELFWKLYKLYVTTVLPKNIQHPYLFVSLKTEQPYTINAFRDSYARAIKKIGLDSSKNCGTTPHAHRHSYGQNLENAKIDVRIIQKALHHRSPLSQMVYTMPGLEKINEVLNSADHFIDEKLLSSRNLTNGSKIDNLIEYLGERHYGTNN